MSDKWIDKYFSLAHQVSTWSKDPSTKVGAVAVGAKGQILSQGYNGFPRGIDDTEQRLNDRGLKYRFVVHAEQNCIYNATLNGVSLADSDLYIWGLPLCSECAKGVIQVGVKRVFMCYPTEIPDKWRESFELTAAMLKEARVEWKCYEKSLSGLNESSQNAQHNGSSQEEHDV